MERLIGTIKLKIKGDVRQKKKKGRKERGCQKTKQMRFANKG
jgi:hypothetical protein